MQSGDATKDSAIIWSRADRPSRLWVQTSRRPDFRGSRVVRGPVVTPDTDCTGKVRLRNLPSDTRLYYRVRAESLERPGLFGTHASGSLTTAPVRREDIRAAGGGAGRRGSSARRGRHGRDHDGPGPCATGLVVDRTSDGVDLLAR